jgi:toxin YoeB
MIYELLFTKKAEDDIKKLKKSDAAAFKKLEKLLLELIEHPYTGSGNPEMLKHNLAGLYSRRISKKHRLIYAINDTEITVAIISAKEHYGDR